MQAALAGRANLKKVRAGHCGPAMGRALPPGDGPAGMHLSRQPPGACLAPAACCCGTLPVLPACIHLPACHLSTHPSTQLREVLNAGLRLPVELPEVEDLRQVGGRFGWMDGSSAGDLIGLWGV